MIFTDPLRAYPPQKYTYPDPIPEFAEAETQKFRAEILKKLSKDKEPFGDGLETVIEVCVEEYEGPGTLLVEPFTDMLIALKERKLPGAPLAARTSLLWLKIMLMGIGRLGFQTHPSDTDIRACYRRVILEFLVIYQ